MGENLLVGVIVVTVLFLAVRSLYRTATGKGGGCGCASGRCSVSDRSPRNESTEATQGAHCHSCRGGVPQVDMGKEKHA